MCSGQRADTSIVDERTSKLSIEESASRMDSTRTARYDADKAVRGLVEELRDVKLLNSEADAILWAAEGSCSRTLPPMLTPWRLTSRL
jgi:hypothetical protein